MKIFYTKRYMQAKELYSQDNNVIILSSNSWNDYGYKQTFSVTIVKEGIVINSDLRMKILFLNQNDSQSAYSYLESLMEEKIHIDFEDIAESFISVNSFYNEILTYFGSDNNYEESFKFAEIIKDLLFQEYLINEGQKTLLENDVFDLLKANDIFNTSLLREQSIKRSRENGFINSLNNHDYKLEDCKFDFSFTLNNCEYKLVFDFYHDVLDSPINILIGKNGVGKTKSLEMLVNYLLNPNKEKNSLIKEFNVETTHPTFISNLIVFSYNPYEKIPIKTNNISIEYNYFGPRRLKAKSENISSEILKFISSNEELNLLKYILNDKFNPENKTNAIDILKKEFNNIDLKNIENILDKSDIFTDSYIVDVNNYERLIKNSFFKICEMDKNKSVYSEADKLKLFYINLNKHIDFVHTIGIKVMSNNKIIPIEKYDDLYNNKLNEISGTEIVFLNKDKEEIKYLSSGQKTFIQFFINIFSMIKPNSLIILDEPENTLHPTFEVEFIELLQKILKAFNSFAIIATHSATITREIPSHNVQIIIRDGKTNEIEIQKPVINTFGASISSINNYVFDDLFTEKREINKWLEKELKEYGDFDDFEKAYVDFISSELMQKAYNLYKKNF